MEIIYQFESFTNNTNKSIEYIIYYFNCFGHRQQKSEVLHPNQTLQLFNAGSKATFFI